MILRPAFLLVTALFVVACGNDQPTSSQLAAEDPTEFLNKLFDEHFERSLELSPIGATSIGDDRYDDQYANSIGPVHREASRALDEEFLQRILTVDRDGLSQQDKLSYDIFKLKRETSLAGKQFPRHLAPMNQFRSATSSFVNLGSGTGIHPFKTVKNYKRSTT
jgi:uncharacterized protein (DUF885 family)